ncbi:FAD-dependent oxidoreductase [Halorussus caseinilyticus]|uniref:FAD-dependent oxidoreductase n=1 Tax=Halorussus caseinilyticus TaxID=3034025 RepID=A0ABD5WFJ8_9EURY
MSEKAEKSPVVVAGAGPTGMTAALALRARGVPTTIVEADSEDRNRDGTRAIYVHGSTLRTLERIDPGLGKRLVERGLVWPTRRTLWRGEEVFSRTYDDPGGSGDIPHFTSLPQTDTETFLRDALEENGVEIQWDSAVERVESGPDGVRLETAGGDVWETEYLVGADGAGSTVRNEIGVDFRGSQSENSFVIVDVEETPENPCRTNGCSTTSIPALAGETCWSSRSRAGGAWTSSARSPTTRTDSVARRSSAR